MQNTTSMVPKPSTCSQEGSPSLLKKTIYQHNQPETFEQWRKAALQRQGLWFHMHARHNLDKFKSTTAQKATSPRPFFALNGHPDAMDINRMQAHLAISEDMEQGIYKQWEKDKNSGQRGRGGPPFRPRGGFLQRSVQF